MSFTLNQDRAHKDEFYGWCWTIESDAGNQAVMVSDPGDGSSRQLAERILALMNTTESTGGES